MLFHFVSNEFSLKADWSNTCSGSSVKCFLQESKLRFAYCTFSNFATLHSSVEIVVWWKKIFLQGPFTVLTFSWTFNIILKCNLMKIPHHSKCEKNEYFTYHYFSWMFELPCADVFILICWGGNVFVCAYYNSEVKGHDLWHHITNHGPVWNLHNVETCFQFFNAHTVTIDVWLKLKTS